MERKPILIIEDDQAIRECLQTVLETEGFHVYTAENGEQGLRALHEIERPCLILLDLMMPIMTGWEFLERKAKEGAIIATIPVIVVSAAGDVATKAASGSSELIKKPIDLEQLFRTVLRYCNPNAK